MSRDESDADSGVDAGDVSEIDNPTDARGGEGSGGGSTDLAARLSTTVTSRRAYGAERLPDPDSGLFTARERQYLRQAHRLDDDDRDAVEDVVADRLSEFVDTDWPVIRDSCPDIAATLREELCGGER